MIDPNAYISPFWPFQPVPLPRNPAEVRTMVVSSITGLVFGLVVVLWIGWRHRKRNFEVKNKPPRENSLNRHGG